MYETLFAPALWLPAAALVVGIVVFIVGNNRVNKPIRNAGAGVAGLAVLWFVLASVIQTPVEQAVSRTKAIVVAVREAQWPTLSTLLDNGTAVQIFSGRKEVTDRTQYAAERYQLKDITILNTDTEVTQPANDIYVTINTLLEGMQPTTGKFRFEYERRSDGLLLREIVPVQIGDRPLDELQRYMSK